jgi:hypothetical protein
MLYVHPVRSAGQATAEKVANAVPRRVVRPHTHPTPTIINEGSQRPPEEADIPLTWGIRVDPVYQHPNRLISVAGPEITVPPVATRALAGDDAQ